MAFTFSWHHHNSKIILFASCNICRLFKKKSVFNFSAILIRWLLWLPKLLYWMAQLQHTLQLISSCSHLPVGRGPVYTSASLHLFIGYLLPTGVASSTLLTKRSSAIPAKCTLHSVLLLCTQDVTVWIPHISRILSFLILSNLVLFIILPRVCISVTSNICVIFAVSVRVSAA